MIEKENIEERERRVFEEIVKEAEEEVSSAKEETGKMHGVLSIIIAISGLLLVIFAPIIIAPIISILLGGISLLLAKYAIEHNSKKLGRIGGIIGVIDILAFIIISVGSLFIGGRLFS